MSLKGSMILVLPRMARATGSPPICGFSSRRMAASGWRDTLCDPRACRKGEGFLARERCTRFLRLPSPVVPYGKSAPMLAQADDDAPMVGILRVNQGILRARIHEHHRFNRSFERVFQTANHAPPACVEPAPTTRAERRDTRHGRGRQLPRCPCRCRRWTPKHPRTAHQAVRRSVRQGGGESRRTCGLRLCAPHPPNGGVGRLRVKFVFFAWRPPVSGVCHPSLRQ